MILEKAVFTVGGKKYSFAKREDDGSILLVDDEGTHRTIGKGTLDGFRNPKLLAENALASYYHVVDDLGEKILVSIDRSSGQLSKIRQAVVTSTVSAHVTYR